MFGNSGNDLHGRAKADYLVNEIGKRVQERHAHLDANNDRSFGGFGFRYDVDRNVLISRVFIAKAYFDISPEATENFRKVAAALNDPRIGGLFEHAGGYFGLDEKQQKYFLLKDHPVDTVTAKELWSDTEDQLNLGARWSFKWFGHAARITHGFEQPPAHPVTRKNDPYPRN